MSEKISGGYYIKARCIKDSEVHRMPPHVREIWDYCLREANHKDVYYNGFLVKRGQLFRNYKDIRDDLCWYIGYRKMMYNENHTKKAMKALREARMIDTSKELGGVLITVLKYDFYQDPKNYESTNEITNESTTKEPSKNHPIPANNKNDKNDKNERINKYPEHSKEFRLSLYLFNKIKERKPDIKTPDLQHWSKHADYILRIDRRNMLEVKQVIDWCQLDDFWQDNILSTAKLRKQYDKLVMKMRKESTNKGEFDFL